MNKVWELFHKANANFPRLKVFFKFNKLINITKDPAMEGMLILCIIDIVRQWSNSNNI
jgi:hypothetical protein